MLLVSKVPSPLLFTIKPFNVRISIYIQYGSKQAASVYMAQLCGTINQVIIH